MLHTFLYKAIQSQPTGTLLSLTRSQLHDPLHDDASGVVYVEAEGESEIGPPTGHTAHTRSVVGVAAATYMVPAGHVGDCGVQLVGRTAPNTYGEGVLSAEKVPGAQVVQVRSASGVLGAE